MQVHAQRGFGAVETHYLDKTVGLMLDFGILYRDTFDWSRNLDDFYTNGRYDGPRLLQIEWSPTAEMPHITGKRTYQIPGFFSRAYDAHRIIIPEYYRGVRDDPIIHECVHFLQPTSEAV